MSWGRSRILAPFDTLYGPARLSFAIFSLSTPWLWRYRGEKYEEKHVFWACFAIFVDLRLFWSIFDPKWKLLKTFQMFFWIRSDHFWVYYAVFWGLVGFMYAINNPLRFFNHSIPCKNWISKNKGQIYWKEWLSEAVDRLIVSHGGCFPPVPPTLKYVVLERVGGTGWSKKRWKYWARNGSGKKNPGRKKIKKPW